MVLDVAPLDLELSEERERFEEDESSSSSLRRLEEVPLEDDISLKIVVKVGGAGTPRSLRRSGSKHHVSDSQSPQITAVDSNGANSGSRKQTLRNYWQFSLLPGACNCLEFSATNQTEMDMKHTLVTLKH